MTKFACDSKCQTWGRWPAAERLVKLHCPPDLSLARRVSLSTNTKLIFVDELWAAAGDRSWWQILRPRYICVRICCHLLRFRAKQPRWEKVERGAPQAGTHHPSPQEIKVNNQGLASCSRNLIMFWSERLQLRVWGSKCVYSEEEIKQVIQLRSNHSWK